jgi:phage terminase Nu1 subunit (DNA packaging protein)
VSREGATVIDLERVRQARDDTEPWVTKAQIAAHVGYSTRWVELRVREGLPCRRWGGRLRFRKSAVEQWLEQREAS